eukprot:tig00000704_g3290.t1
MCGQCWRVIEETKWPSAELRVKGGRPRQTAWRDSGTNGRIRKWAGAGGASRRRGQAARRRRRGRGGAPTRAPERDRAYGRGGRGGAGVGDPSRRRGGEGPSAAPGGASGGPRALPAEGPGDDPYLPSRTLSGRAGESSRAAAALQPRRNASVATRTSALGYPLPSHLPAQAFSPQTFTRGTLPPSRGRTLSGRAGESSRSAAAPRLRRNASVATRTSALGYPLPSHLSAQAFSYPFRAFLPPPPSSEVEMGPGRDPYPALLYRRRPAPPPAERGVWPGTAGSLPPCACAEGAGPPRPRNGTSRNGTSRRGGRARSSGRRRRGRAKLARLGAAAAEEQEPSSAPSRPARGRLGRELGPP